MFKNLILFIAIGTVIWLVRRMLSNKLKNNHVAENKEIKNIVQCKICQTFIPEDKAIKQNQLTFCSQQHANDWKNDNQ